MKPLLFAGLLGLGSIAGCQETEPLAKPFPKDFLWGTATAGFQVDMGCPSAPCLDTASDWYQWVTTDVTIQDGLVNGDDLRRGPGHWELYEHDFDLLQDDLHNNAYRMSIEWSRLFPHSTTAAATPEAVAALADPDAVAHYHAVFAALRQRGITPLVTLNHYTLPLWIHDGAGCYVFVRDGGDAFDCPRNGWLDRDTILTEIAKYAAFAASEFGAEVDAWATMNEPYAVVLAGYAIPTPSERTNPPGYTDLSFRYARDVILNMIEAHARMYDAVHAADTVDADSDGVNARVGLVVNLASAQPKNPDNEFDVRGVENFDYLYNDLFLDALTRGNWDSDIDGSVDEVRDDLAGRMDYIGINYYTSLTIIGNAEPIAEYVPVVTFIPDSGILFNFRPDGLYSVVMRTWERYGLPIYITENGTPVDSEISGAAALIPHLAWLRKAIADGADVRGYFYWSLVDNYEWNHGYEMEFGLYDYDEQTRARIARPVAAVYGEIAARNRLTSPLLQDWGGTFLPEAE